ncbi:hypothetical protein NDU88_007297 [Pleurodeles waltl]|uniref:Uncharacterized protein n=1 Tax=Pleurodeles waltl TaxID=8319 RepID=A0AAV7WFR8_PLEWA|nr:hypothetical protein NDU88_007297 [Pleurodeles waltl]
METNLRWRPGRELSFELRPVPTTKYPEGAPPDRRVGRGGDGGLSGHPVPTWGLGLRHRGCESQRAGTRGRPRPHGTPGTELRDWGPQLQRQRSPKCSIDWSGERERGGADPSPP